MEKAKRQPARSEPRSRSKRDPIETEISELVPVAFVGRSILVVEADPEVQARIARGLSRRGNRVVGTGSGDGALALVSQWDVDLVLISDCLPGRSGVEVMRLIHKVRPEATLILMSDNLEPAIRLAALGAGAGDCIRKPISDDELGLVLRKRGPAHKQHDVVAQ